MWTDEICRMDDVPDAGPVETFRTGFGGLDEHGWRLVTPAFMPVIGPYGSGKSVFLRQLLVNLWRIHGWRFLLTSFEEKIKPRYERDLRRNLIKTRAIGIDMETATIFSAGFHNEIPTGAILLVSDQPMIPEGVKTEASDKLVTSTFVDAHVKIGIESLRLIRRHGKSVKHLRFDDEF